MTEQELQEIEARAKCLRDNGWDPTYLTEVLLNDLSKGCSFGKEWTDTEEEVTRFANALDKAGPDLLALIAEVRRLREVQQKIRGLVDRLNDGAFAGGYYPETAAWLKTGAAAIARYVLPLLDDAGLGEDT